jgi:hypothetical protein
MTDHFDPSVGLLQKATILKYIPGTDKVLVKLAHGQSALKGQNPLVPIEIQAPHGLFYNNGLFIGTLPAEGTPVIIAQGNTGYHFVSFIAENINKVPDLKSGELLIKSNDKTKMLMNVSGNIVIGSDINRINIDTNARSNLITTSFDTENHFTQAHRQVQGSVRRDKNLNKYFPDGSKLADDDYFKKLVVVGMDPSISANSESSGPNKNPPFVESRELIYEFQYNSNISDDLTEAELYSNPKAEKIDLSFLNRRKNRADTLSLSLVAPNYLMETVKGTVVDFFGNVLDLNRYPLPVGTNFNQNTIDQDKSKDKTASFLLIKEIERKSIAYHFEINARKNLTSIKGLSLPDITSNADYARNRSRFFVDIDKEGQFKLNVPASSEKGNVPLLTRYENYSTFGTEDGGNPNKQIYQGAGNSFDIYHDSFAASSRTAVSAGFLDAKDKGSVNLVAGDNAPDAVPQDRITGATIKHGTAYHDILQTCFTHQDHRYIKYATREINPKTVNLDSIPVLKDLVSTTITISGDKANAGGRSGSINFDGSIDLNIGANTVDRQSMWIDTAGGVVGTIGRDRNNRSVILSSTGDFFLQVGGFGILGDSRFPQGEKYDNGVKGAVLDLRIMTNGGYTHMIRCDDQGISIMSPGRLAFHAKGELILTSDTSIKIEAPNCKIQERGVLRNGVSV